MVSAQIITMVLRCGPGHEYGDPDWQYCIFVVSPDNENATVLGLKGDGHFTKAHAAAFIRKIKSFGFKKVHWDRKKSLAMAKHLQF